MTLNIIKRNYHPEAIIPRKNLSVSEKIHALPNKSRYPVTKPRVTFTKRKIILISAIIILSVFATANAKTVYKTYKELTKTMFVDKALLNISGIKHTGIYSDEEYVKSIYEKYGDEVSSQIANLMKRDCWNLLIT
ncbi:MAG: hypothetical protein GYA02_02550 [Clostridiaceae bacterium]|nr:hypothetical protein [Clostridiaceae bacterium]